LGFKGDPDTLGVCPVFGEPLGSMGDPVPYVHEGRDIKFCCSGCPPKFEADPAKYLSKLDELMILDQKPRYPLTTDVVTGEALPADETIVDVVYLNRLVRFGSQDSAATFAKSPDAYIAKLNEAVIAKQKDEYPTEKCVVSGKSLDSMGEPVQKVYANRLVQFCCDNCPAQFEAAPLKYLPMLEKGAASPAETEHESDHDHK
jgi:YHS domain-containing protein